MKTVKKRRLKRKTDYKSRLALLKSEMPRLVVRKTNRYLIAQIVKTEISQDYVLLSKSTKDLLSLGWPIEKSGSLKNLNAAYALGFKIGTEAQKNKVKEVILDFGMHRNKHKSRIYSLLKGALDSGLKIEHSPNVLPSLDEINKNKELTEIVKKIIGGKN